MDSLRHLLSVVGSASLSGVTSTDSHGGVFDLPTGRRYIPAYRAPDTYMASDDVWLRESWTIKKRDEERIKACEMKAYEKYWVYHG